MILLNTGLKEIPITQIMRKGYICVCVWLFHDNIVFQETMNLFSKIYVTVRVSW